MRGTQLVPILSFIVLASASWTASAQMPSGGQFFSGGWFATHRGDRPAASSNPGNGGERSGPGNARPQEVRPQGDLRGDIYNHIREQRQPSAPQGQSPGGGGDRQRGGRGGDRGR